MSTRVIPFPASRSRTRPAAPLAAIFRQLARALADADRRARERRYLEEMDDRTLRDIGVTRADIEAELHRPAPSDLPFLRR